MKNHADLLKKNWAVALIAIFCCLLWGSAIPCIKLGYQLLHINSSDTSTQLVFAGCRFAAAGFLVVLFGSIFGRKAMIPSAGSFGMIFRLCLVQTVMQYLFFYISLAHTSGVAGSIIQASNIFFSILISALIFRYEKLSAGKLFGCAVGFAGVMLIQWNGMSADFSFSFLGEGFMLLSTLSSAFATAIVKKYSRKVSPVALSGWQFLIGGIILWIIGTLSGGRLHGFTLASAALLGYLALLSATAFSLWSVLLKHNPVSRVAVFGFINPIFSVLLSSLLLHEQNQAFTWKSLVSLILVSIGIYAVNRSASDPVKKAAHA